MGKVIKIMLPSGIIAASFIAVFLMTVAKEPPVKNATPEAIPRYEVNEIHSQLVQVVVDLFGEVKAESELTLIAEVSGRIESIHPAFNAGGTIDANEVLIKIKDEDYRLAVVQAEAQVAIADLALQENIADAEVARKQLPSGSHTPLALKQPQIAQARAQLKAAEAGLQKARLDLARTAITLPFTSRIRSKLVGVGQYVPVGVSLGEAYSTENAEVRLAFTDDQLIQLGISMGYKAEKQDALKVKVTANVAGRDYEWWGWLARVDAAYERQTRLIYGYVKVEAPYEQVRGQEKMPLAIGSFISAQVRATEPIRAYVIPSEALHYGNRVYVVNNGQVFSKRLSVFQQRSESLVVLDGLKDGDLIVTSPVSAVVEGARAEAVVAKPIATQNVFVIQEQAL